MPRHARAFIFRVANARSLRCIKHKSDTHVLWSSWCRQADDKPEPELFFRHRRAKDNIRTAALSFLRVRNHHLSGPVRSASHSVIAPMPTRFCEHIGRPDSEDVVTARALRERGALTPKLKFQDGRCVGAWGIRDVRPVTKLGGIARAEFLSNLSWATPRPASARAGP